MKQRVHLVRNLNQRSFDDSAFLYILLMKIRGINTSYPSSKKHEKENNEKSLVLEIK